MKDNASSPLLVSGSVDALVVLRPQSQGTVRL
jgi:hypothetical protein